MKRHLVPLLVLCVMACAVVGCSPADKQVVILFTNDTHSQIDPIAVNAKRNADMGGVERRKVLIDSLREVHPHALLVDAGDAVQGTPYFNFYAGEVETMVMNELGYDVRTLGNHEFDNGGEALAAMLAAYKGVTVSSNYQLHRPDLQAQVVPSWLCDAGGVKVGFVGINVNPEGLLFPVHARDITYLDPIAVGDSLALELRKQGANVVVALSHLGYTGEEVNTNVIDSVLVRHTRYIDFVVGGHSHTVLSAPAVHANLDGRMVAVGQTGKSGVNLGYAIITIPADEHRGVEVEYRLMPVDARYDNRLDADFANRLSPYRAQVDSAMSVVLGISEQTMTVARPESALSNWACDAFAEMARHRTGKSIDFAVINTGGIRADFPAGEITRGHIWQTFPFTNYMSIVELRGSDVRDLFDQIAGNGGEGVSKEVRMTIAGGNVEQLTIGGREIADDRLYRVATINFVAEGGDGMVAFRKAVSREDYPGFVYELMENYIVEATQKGQAIGTTSDRRIIIKN